MSSYHSSFSYLNENSKTKKWIISHFEADDGEQDSYLSQDQVYTDSYNGAKRNLYGTRWNAVANVKITVIKQDGGDFTFAECREASKWLTGNPEASWLELYVGDEMKSRLLIAMMYLALVFCKNSPIIPKVPSTPKPEPCLEDCAEVHPQTGSVWAPRLSGISA